MTQKVVFLENIKQYIDIHTISLPNKYYIIRLRSRRDNPFYLSQFLRERFRFHFLSTCIFKSLSYNGSGYRINR